MLSEGELPNWGQGLDGKNMKKQLNSPSIHDWFAIHTIKKTHMTCSGSDNKRRCGRFGSKKLSSRIDNYWPLKLAESEISKLQCGRPMAGFTPGPSETVKRRKCNVKVTEPILPADNFRWRRFNWSDYTLLNNNKLEAAHNKSISCWWNTCTYIYTHYLIQCVCVNLFQQDVFFIKSWTSKCFASRNLCSKKQFSTYDVFSTKN